MTLHEVLSAVHALSMMVFAITMCVIVFVRARDGVFR